MVQGNTGATKKDDDAAVAAAQARQEAIEFGPDPVPPEKPPEKPPPPLATEAYGLEESIETGLPLSDTPESPKASAPTPWSLPEAPTPEAPAWTPSFAGGPIPPTPAPDPEDIALGDEIDFSTYTGPPEIELPGRYPGADVGPPGTVQYGRWEDMPADVQRWERMRRLYVEDGMSEETAREHAGREIYGNIPRLHWGGNYARQLMTESGYQGLVDWYIENGYPVADAYEIASWAFHNDDILLEKESEGVWAAPHRWKENKDPYDEQQVELDNIERILPPGWSMYFTDTGEPILTSPDGKEYGPDELVFTVDGEIYLKLEEETVMTGEQLRDEYGFSIPDSLLGAKFFLQPGVPEITQDTKIELEDGEIITQGELNARAEELYEAEEEERKAARVQAQNIVSNVWSDHDLEEVYYYAETHLSLFLGDIQEIGRNEHTEALLKLLWPEILPLEMSYIFGDFTRLDPEDVDPPWNMLTGHDYGGLTAADFDAAVAAAQARQEAIQEVYQIGGPTVDPIIGLISTVFPDRNPSTILDTLGKDPTDFINDILSIGRNTDTETLLTYLGLTEEEMDEFFAVYPDQAYQGLLPEEQERLIGTIVRQQEKLLMSYKVYLEISTGATLPSFDLASVGTQDGTPYISPTAKAIYAAFVEEPAEPPTVPGHPMTLPGLHPKVVERMQPAGEGFPTTLPPISNEAIDAMNRAAAQQREEILVTVSRIWPGISREWMDSFVINVLSDPDKFLEKIKVVGRTPDTEKLLKLMFGSMSERTLTKLFDPPPETLARAIYMTAVNFMGEFRGVMEGTSLYRDAIGLAWDKMADIYDLKDVIYFDGGYSPVKKWLGTPLTQEELELIPGYENMNPVLEMLAWGSDTGPGKAFQATMGALGQIFHPIDMAWSSSVVRADLGVKIQQSLPRDPTWPHRYSTLPLNSLGQPTHQTLESIQNMTYAQLNKQYGVELSKEDAATWDLYTESKQKYGLWDRLVSEELGEVYRSWNAPGWIKGLIPWINPVYFIPIAGWTGLSLGIVLKVLPNASRFSKILAITQKTIAVTERAAFYPITKPAELILNTLATPIKSAWKKGRDWGIYVEMQSRWHHYTGKTKTALDDLRQAQIWSDDIKALAGENAKRPPVPHVVSTAEMVDVKVMAGELGLNVQRIFKIVPNHPEAVVKVQGLGKVRYFNSVSEAKKFLAELAEMEATKLARRVATEKARQTELTLGEPARREAVIEATETLNAALAKLASVPDRLKYFNQGVAAMKRWWAKGDIPAARAAIEQKVKILRQQGEPPIARPGLTKKEQLKIEYPANRADAYKFGARLQDELMTARSKAGEVPIAKDLAAKPTPAKPTPTKVRRNVNRATEKKNTEAVGQTPRRPSEFTEKPIAPSLTREGLEAGVASIEGVSKKQARRFVDLVEARANALGKRLDDYIAERFESIGFGTEGNPFLRGTVQFQADGRAIIRAFKGADISTLIHELAHIFRRDLLAADLAIVEKWARVKGGNWTLKAEEKFASAFEKYLRSGQPPTEKLRKVFAVFKRWLTEIYARIKGSQIDIKISPEVRGVFDRMLGKADPKALALRAAEANIVTRKAIYEKAQAALNKWSRPGLLSSQEVVKMHKAADAVKESLRLLKAAEADRDAIVQAAKSIVPPGLPKVPQKRTLAQQKLPSDVQTLTVPNPQLRTKSPEDLNISLKTTLKPIPNSPLDAASSSYLDTGNFMEFVRNHLHYSDLKLAALSKVARENIKELENMVRMGLKELDSIFNEATAKVGTTSAMIQGFRNQAKELKRDITWFQRTIAELKKGNDLTIEQAATLGIALRKTKRGKIVPALRESGFYVTKEFAEYPFFDDIGYISGQWMDTIRMVQAIDGGYSSGVLSKFVLWPTDRTHRAAMHFLDTYKMAYHQLERKYGMHQFFSKKYRETAGEVLEHISKKEAAVPAEILLTKKEIQQYLAKFDLDTQTRIVKFAQEVRVFFDDMIDMQNLVRGKRGQSKIEYLKNYRPWVADRNAQARIRYTRHSTESFFSEKEYLPDYIVPEKPFISHDLARKNGLKGHDMVTDLRELTVGYVNSAGKDIFNTSIIQNVKVHASVLRGMGYGNSAKLLETWVAETYGGVLPRFMRAAMENPLLGWSIPVPLPKWTDWLAKGGIEISPIRNMMTLRRHFTRAVFPLNLPWNLFVQTSSLALIPMRYGIRNTLRGLDSFTPSGREYVKNTTSHIIKTTRAGKMAWQDLAYQIETNAKFETSVIDNAADALNFLTNTLEDRLTGIAIRAAYHKGKQMGLKGRALREYASDGGAKTQSMYNIEHQPGVLRERLITAIFPFQTFFVEIMNTTRELAGVSFWKAGAWHTMSATSAQGKATISGRMKMLIEWIAAMMAVNSIADKAIDRKPWQPSSFLPFFALFRGGFSASGQYDSPLPYQWMQEGKKGIDELFQYGTFNGLRKWITGYHVVGGLQLNRIWDGIEAGIAGEWTNVKGEPEFETPVNDWLDLGKLILLGPYKGSVAGEEENRQREAEESWLESTFGISVPKRVLVDEEIAAAFSKIGDVDENNLTFDWPEFITVVRNIQKRAGPTLFNNGTSPFIELLNDHDTAVVNIEAIIPGTLKSLKPEEMQKWLYSGGKIDTYLHSLWAKYHLLVEKQDEDLLREFEEAHPEITTNWREKWRIANPDQDALIAFMAPSPSSSSRVHSMEAYDQVIALAKEMGLDTMYLATFLPPEDTAEGYFDYIAAVAAFGANSPHARYVRLTDDAFAEWGQDAYGWEDLPSDLDERALLIKIDNYDKLVFYDNFSARYSWNYIENRTWDELYVDSKLGEGTIDLTNRPQVKNADGSISTVKPISFSEDDLEILIPTIRDDGTTMSRGEAIRKYYETGKHFGKFNSVEEVEAYAARLQAEQAVFYAKDGNPREVAKEAYLAANPAFAEARYRLVAYAAGSTDDIDVEDIIEAYVEYRRIVDEHGASSHQAKLFRLQSIDETSGELGGLDTWGQSDGVFEKPWEPIDEDIRALEIRVQFDADWEAFNGLGDIESYTERAIAKDKYLEENLGFETALAQYDAYTAGDADDVKVEDIIEAYVEYRRMQRIYGDMSSEAKLIRLTDDDGEVTVDGGQFEEWLQDAIGNLPIKGQDGNPITENDVRVIQINVDSRENDEVFDSLSDKSNEDTLTFVMDGITYEMTERGKAQFLLLHNNPDYENARAEREAYKLGDADDVDVEDIIEAYVEYRRMQRIYGDRSPEATLIRANDKDFATWGQSTKGWEPIDEDVRVLQISIDNRVQDEEYNGLGDIESYTERAIAKDKYLEENPDYEKERYRREAYEAGDAGDVKVEDIIETYVEFKQAQRIYGDMSSEAKLVRANNPNLEQWFQAEHTPGFEPIEDDIRVLEIDEEYSKNDEEYNGFGVVGSENFKSNEGTHTFVIGGIVRSGSELDEARLQYMHDNPEYAMNYHRRSAIEAGWPDEFLDNFVEMKMVSDIYGPNTRPVTLYKKLNEEFFTWGLDNNIWKNDYADARIGSLSISKEFFNEDNEYEAIGKVIGQTAEKTKEERKAYLAAHPDYAEARLERDAYDHGYSEQNIALYVEYMNLPTTGYDRQRFLMAHEDFYNQRVQLGAQPESFKGVPTVEFEKHYAEFYAIYDHQTSRGWAARYRFRGLNPWFDEEGQKIYGWQPYDPSKDKWEQYSGGSWSASQ